MEVASTENAERYTWGDHCDGWHLAKSSNLSVIQEKVPPGASEVKHYHKKAEQFFYVLSGVATLEVNGKLHKVYAHEGLHIPAGKTHQLRNDTNKDLTFIVISTPPSHGDRIRV